VGVGSEVGIGLKLGRGDKETVEAAETLDRTAGDALKLFVVTAEANGEAVPSTGGGRA